jgi:hypothetical protein
MPKYNNFQNVISVFDHISKTVESGVNKGIWSVCKKTHNTIIQDSKEQKHGRTYTNVVLKNGKIKKVHIASAENRESSARLSGELNEARDFTVDKMTGKLGVNTNKAPYGKWIEDTRQDTKRGVEKNVKDLENDIIQGIMVAFKQNFS